MATYAAILAVVITVAVLSAVVACVLAPRAVSDDVMHQVIGDAPRIARPELELEQRIGPRASASSSTIASSGAIAS